MKFEPQSFVQTLKENEKLLLMSIFSVCLIFLLTLSKTRNFRLFQTERVCKQHNFHNNDRKSSEQAENTVGKGQIAPYEQFVLFTQRFQKTCTCKNKGLFGKGLNHTDILYQI